MNINIISKRTRRIINQIGLSSLYKIVSMSINFLLVPISINYLGSEKYGLWLTIFSFIGWFSFFDFGIGNGLRNKLSEAFATSDNKLAKYYVSTAYFSMMFVVTILIIIFLLFYYFIPWAILFNYTENSESLAQLIVIVYIIFSINLILKMVTSIYFADQKSSVAGLIQMVGQLVIFISIYLAISLTDSSLIVYGSIIVGSQMIVLSIANILTFYIVYPLIKPSFKYFKKIYLSDILKLGGQFFLIQISYVLIYSVDNFTINYFLGSSQVTVYNIAFKYFMFARIGMAIILEPYWSAFTNAMVNSDTVWIQSSLKKLFIVSTFISLLVLVMILGANKFYFLWIGDSVLVPFSLTVIVGINAIFEIYLRPIFMFLNGISKIKIQLYLGMLLAVVNLPLSILLAVYFELGVIGVILATTITRIIELCIYPIQVYKLIFHKATGIWNE